MDCVLVSCMGTLFRFLNPTDPTLDFLLVVTSTSASDAQVL